MRKLFLVILVALFMAGAVCSSVFAATPGSRTSPGRGEIAQMPYPSDPPKRFRLVRYIGLQDLDGIAATSIVIWDKTVDDGVTITTTTVSGDSSVAGILATTILTQDTVDNSAVQDIGLDNWAWLQTYGYALVDVSSANSIIAGAAMGTGTTAGLATIYMPSTDADWSTRTVSQGFAGFFFDDAAKSATDVEAFVRTE